MLLLGNHNHHELHKLFFIRCPTIALYSWEAIEWTIKSTPKLCASFCQPQWPASYASSGLNPITNQPMHEQTC